MGKKKSKVKMTAKIEQGNLEPKPIEKEHIKISGEKQEMFNPVILISRLNYPITVKYDKSNIRISPRGRVKIADKSKLGKKPNGLLIKELK